MIAPGRTPADPTATPLAVTSGGSGDVLRLPGERPGRARRRPAISRLIGPLVLSVCALGVWLFFTYVMLDAQRRFLLPPPWDVVTKGFFNGHARAEILRGLLATTEVAVVGLAIAIVLGVGLAVIMSQARWIEDSVWPYAVLLQTIPILALVPLIGFWIGFNFRSRVIVCVIIALFPIITNTLFGLKSAESGLGDLFTLHGASRWTRLRKLQFPAALPAIFTGLRISAGLSVIGAIVGDFFFRQGKPGIGRLLDIYRADLDAEKLLVAVFFSSLLGLATFWLFGWIGNRVTRQWHESAGAGHR